MFDPFAEARPEQLTIPAESEIGDLLDEPAVERPARRDRGFEPVTEPFDPGAGRSAIRPRRRHDHRPRRGPSRRPVEGAALRSQRGRCLLQRPRPSTRTAQRRRACAMSSRSAGGTTNGPRARGSTSPRERRCRSGPNGSEQEARALPEGVARARGLLACSEILAVLGDRDRAGVLATEARDQAPSIALAHRQARGLMPSPPDAEMLRKALDVEIKMTPGVARVHSMLLAADAAAADGDAEDAGERLDQAARIAPTDARVAAGRAARALAKRDPASAAALRLADVPELAPIAEALSTCLRLRGADQAAGAVRASPNEVLMRAREALDAGDLSAAAALVAELASVPELARGALWLAAALGAARGDGRARASAWLRDLVDRGEEEACRPLAARALETSDASLMGQTLERPGPLRPAERLVLATLFGLRTAADEHLRSTAAAGGLDPLVSAAAALAIPAADDPDRGALAQARAKHSAGSSESRALVELGRLLGASAAPEAIEKTLAAVGPARNPAARAIALEMAARAGRVSDVSATLEAWGASRGSAEDQAVGALAAAVVAERAGDRPRALQGYKAVRSADGTSEVALRAIASLEQVDLVAEMNALADELGRRDPRCRGAARGRHARRTRLARADADSPPRQRAQGGARASDRRFPRGADRAPGGRRRRDPAMDPRPPSQRNRSHRLGARRRARGAARRRSRSGSCSRAPARSPPGTTQRRRAARVLRADDDAARSTIEPRGARDAPQRRTATRASCSCSKPRARTSARATRMARCDAPRRRRRETRRSPASRASAPSCGRGGSRGSPTISSRRPRTRKSPVCGARRSSDWRTSISWCGRILAARFSGIARSSRSSPTTSPACATSSST